MGPLRLRVTSQLEGYLAHNCDGARVAGKYSLRVIEDCVPRSEIVQIARAVRSGEERGDIIHPESLPRIATWNVLRMIEQIGELCAETEFKALGDAYVFVSGE